VGLRYNQILPIQSGNPERNHMAEHDQRRLHICTCQECRQQPLGETAELHSSINRVLEMLDEKSRRRFIGLLATQHGYGGVQYFARVTGLSRTTILRGQREISLADAECESRIRVAGGGRPLLEKNNRV
jgi:hypothetical protein